ncbi:MAG: YbaK/EbsC family protein [Blautia sp.]
MSIERVREYFRQYHMEERILEMDQSSATVELAAQAVGVEPARIAKTMSFKKGDETLLVVTAGDRKIDNSKYKNYFGVKAKMLTPDEVIEKVGHPVGGVCPFAVPDQVQVYLDESMKRFETVYPACGSGNSAIGLTCEELERYSHSRAWVDVCKQR